MTFRKTFKQTVVVALVISNQLDPVSSRYESLGTS